MTDGIRLTLATPPTSDTADTAVARPPDTPGGTSFRDALRDAAHGMAEREARIDAVLTRRGAPLAPEQLLALQATVQRHSQEVELASKLVDKLTGTVRQVLTSQQ
ncbi:MAG: hypothetical protein J0L92_16470 [Deltaproteobacteria bacterium]|nr:hypothetical protein [Deltaproteobacteria bacterium]